MTPITFKQIDDVHASLADALRAAQDAAEQAIAVKVALEKARAALVHDGDVAGKNEAEREADLRHKLAGQYALLEKNERVARVARHRVELARLEVDALRMQLRVAELAAREETA